MLKRYPELPLVILTVFFISADIFPQATANDSLTTREITYEQREKRQPKQGLLIFTGDPDVEIFIDGKSYGKHDNLLAELGEGKHIVEGRKKGYCSDYEKAYVANEIVSRVSVTPKRLKVLLTLPLLFSFMGKDGLQAGLLPISGGIKYNKHLLGIFFAIGEGGKEQTYTIDSISYHFWKSTRYIGGINYTYGLYENYHLRLSAGANISYCSHTKYYSKQDTDSFFNLGPRLAIQIGIENLKFISAFNLLVKCGKKEQLFDERIAVTMENGFVITF